MAADFSRVRLNALLDYAGVELKQGGVLLDADANELVAVLDRRMRALASDTLGRATVSSTTPDAFRITPGPLGLEIGKGRLYVDGLLAENHGASVPGADGFDPLMAETTRSGTVSYERQPYWPGPTVLPTRGRHLVYLDVWTRELTHLERPDLVDSAVGVETSSRLQTVWQVRVLALEAGTGAGVDCATPDAALPGWSTLVAPSTGVLTTGVFDIDPADDSCELPPTGGYRGLENQLYRVEIHGAGAPGLATFKWSRENASVGSRVATAVSPTVLELDSLGRDDVLRISSGDWVEIIDDVREFAQEAGELRRVTVDDATRQIRFSPGLPILMVDGSSPESAATLYNLRVRRWDQGGAIFRTDPGGTPVQVQDLDAADATGAITVPGDRSTLLLEHGITVRFASTGEKGFKVGDHWEFAARTADASVELLERAPPRGVHHHYARLAMWDVGGAVSDCRTSWPPPARAAEGCACTYCVTPESHASGVFTIQHAVGLVRDRGGTVCLQAGVYQLLGAVNIDGARSVRITGQGPATMIFSYQGPAFIIERSMAIAIDDLMIVPVDEYAAISVRSVLGLALRRLVIVSAGATSPAIAMGGVVLGATLDNNLIVAHDGIRARRLRPDGERDFLLTAALTIDSNLFWCRHSAVNLGGRVAHAVETRIVGNQVIGCREVGLASTGLALPGASIRISDNNLALHGAGIRCGAGGTWIEGNKIHATADGEHALHGAGIELIMGLDHSGIGQCQILANQVSGCAHAGILIAVPVRTLIVKLNIIEQCRHGILMSGSARGVLVAIDNNQLRAIGLGAHGDTGDTDHTGEMIVGIGLRRVESATVAGNTLSRIGMDTDGRTQFVAGIAAFEAQRVRISGNELIDVGPLDDFRGIVAGILVPAPYRHGDVHHNHVERDAVAGNQSSNTPWYALRMDDAPASAAGAPAGPAGASAGPAGARIGSYTPLALDDGRTVVVFGDRAYVDPGHSRIDANGMPRAQGASASVQGNTCVARGSAPVMEVSAREEILFNGNRCELRAGTGPAVSLATPVAILHANLVRGGRDASIYLAPHDPQHVAAIGNITSAPIVPALPPPMVPLNLIL